MLTEKAEEGVADPINVLYIFNQHQQHSRLASIVDSIVHLFVRLPLCLFTTTNALFKFKAAHF